MGAPNISTFRARRLSDHPVVGAGSAPGYDPVFNAGLLYDRGTYHLFARGIRTGYRRNPGAGPRYLDYVSDILVFESTDGLRYEFGYVLASPGIHAAEAKALEDPRVQRVRSGGEDHVVMTYTHLPSDDTTPWRIGVHRLAHTDDGARFVLEEGSGRLIGPDGIANKDAVLFNLADGRVAMLHRVHPSIQVATFDTLDDLLWAGDEYWDAHLMELEHHTIITPAPGAYAVGAGAPPVLTPDGFLLFFHERRADGAYTVNAALLDAATGRTLARLEEPVLEPELAWEREGDVDNVVFVQGAHRRDDGTIYLTYGAADRAVGAAEVSEDQLLAALNAVR